MSGKPTIAHGKRTGFATLSKGGLNFDSFPMRLFTKGNAKHWNPADIDFTQESPGHRRDDRCRAVVDVQLGCQFMAGEESVTQDLQRSSRRWRRRAGSATRCT